MLFLFLLFVSASGHSWISVRLRDLNFQSECITDRNCERITLSLIMGSKGNEGLRQSSWELSSLLLATEKAEMFEFWRSAALSNITVQSVLTADDVLFNIPRPCDQTPSLALFSPKIFESKDLVDEERIIALVGKCYQVIVEMKLYTQQCPWCLTEQKPITSIPMEYVVLCSGILLFVCGLFVCIFGIFRQNRPKTSNGIPLPPTNRPPNIPFQYYEKKPIEIPISSYYETLDYTQSKSRAESYDSAFEHCSGNSLSRGSLPPPPPTINDSGLSSPHPLQRHPQTDYV